MNKSKVALFASLSLALFLTSCRSRQEAAADKYRKAGDPLHALQYYEEALKRGGVSKEFYKNYTLVNIQAMGLRAKEDPTADFLDVLKDTVASLLLQHPDPESQALFATTLQNIANARIKMGTPEGVEGGFRFLEAAKKAGASGGTDAKQQVVAAQLKQIQGEIDEAAKNPTMGIVADYKLNKLALMIGGETPEMTKIWSPLRKINLNTYLMYDNDDVVAELGERPDARINKYAILLGIVKYEASPKAVKIQVKAWNGGSMAFPYRSEGYTLVDKDGKTYKPTAAIGGFYKGGKTPKPSKNGKPDPGIVQKGDESKTGGVTFNLPSGATPAYLEYKCEAGISRKYLP
ncbi:MAG: hypothetical protein JF616_21850 [Fibrobacteres bacterium]|nr:hypothetical protein [Fibrobacterota bacterium]